MLPSNVTEWEERALLKGISEIQLLPADSPRITIGVELRGITVIQTVLEGVYRGACGVGIAQAGGKDL